MPEGSIAVARLSSDPELYSATFASDESPHDGRRARTLAGVGELRQFLEKAGVPRERITPALREAEGGRTTRIPHVALVESQLRALGLLTPSGTAADPD
jgi:hypothetical protein